MRARVVLPIPPVPQIPIMRTSFDSIAKCDFNFSTRDSIPISPEVCTEIAFLNLFDITSTMSFIHLASDLQRRENNKLWIWIYGIKFSRLKLKLGFYFVLSQLIYSFQFTQHNQTWDFYFFSFPHNILITKKGQESCNSMQLLSSLHVENLDSNPQIKSRKLKRII